MGMTVTQKTGNFFVRQKSGEFTVTQKTGMFYIKEVANAVSGGVVAPTNQPTLLTFTSVTSSGYTVSWTASVGGADVYLAVRRTSASPTYVPVDGTTYNVGDTVGDGEVRHFGAGVTFDESGLSSSTEYFYDIFAGNGAAGTWVYLTTSPLEDSQATLFDFGNALHFNGANSYVIGSVNSFGDNYTNRTLCAWLKWDVSNATMNIVGRMSGANIGWGISSTNAGKIRAIQSTSTGYQQSNYTISNGVWVHVGVLWDNAGLTDADKLKLYINGVLDASTPLGTINVAATSGVKMRFGSLTSGANFFNGWLDSAAMWNVTDESLITAHYAAGLGARATPANLTMECLFDESDPSATTLDETGNNTFTLTNFNYDANDGFDAH